MNSALVTYLKKAVNQKKNQTKQQQTHTKQNKTKRPMSLVASSNTSAETYVLTASTSETLTMRTCTINLFCFSRVCVLRGWWVVWKFKSSKSNLPPRKT